MQPPLMADTSPASKRTVPRPLPDTRCRWGKAHPWRSSLEDSMSRRSMAIQVLTHRWRHT